MIRKKICMLGAYAVGKSSLVRRFVEHLFSERYETTIGVKIMKKRVTVDDDEVTLILWDLHGDDEFQRVKMSYLRGASGYLLVIDGTRADTLERAKNLHERAAGALGDVPFLVLANKSDLGADWELPADFERHLKGWTVLRTSAKTGDGVDEAFLELAERMVKPR